MSKRTIGRGPRPCVLRTTPPDAVPSRGWQSLEHDAMEELYELRTYIETGKYQEALLLLDEMEEMSRDDKINRISSFMEVLLVHLIKQAVEKRTTRSWDVSIRNALRQIIKINKRRKTGGWYLTDEELL